jgi:hypothetical protein
MRICDNPLMLCLIRETGSGERSAASGMVDAWTSLMPKTGSARTSAIAWLRQRDHLEPKDRAEFDSVFPTVLRRAIAQTRSLPR